MSAMSEHIGRTEPAGGAAGFTTVQDRGMLEWARRRPADGFVIGLALRLRGPRPTPERLAALVTARLPLVPALAEHLDGPVREESWLRAGDFDAARHVHRHVHRPDHRLDHDRAGDHRVQAALETMANQPVPENLPRWGLWLLDTEHRDTGHRDTGHHDTYWLVYRVHHAAQDGAAAGHTVRRLLDARTPAPAPRAPHRPDRPDSAHRPGPGRWAVAPAHAPAPTDGRLLATAEVPADALRAVSRASGASLNDVYLAALAGALRAWLPPAGRDRPVPVRVPFSVRLRSERQDRGNRFGYARVLLPVDEPHAAGRLSRVAEQTRSWPRDRNRRILDALPDAMLTPHVSAFLSPGDALATATLLQIPGPLALDGSPVTGGVALPPLVGGYLFSTVLFLHGARATASFTAESRHEHVRDLPRLWEKELTALTDATRA
ncbi:hypothetical protein [Streptomyces sp. NPDC051567]|uniref:hypothetical protein n=1 Tax=Streptomyces sp. NPDC051567 TaxID=3365660 RepID=UPI0037B994A4